MGPGTAMQARHRNDTKAALRSCTLALWVVATPDNANDQTQVHRVAQRCACYTVLPQMQVQPNRPERAAHPAPSRAAGAAGCPAVRGPSSRPPRLSAAVQRVVSASLTSPRSIHETRCGRWLDWRWGAGHACADFLRAGLWRRQGFTARSNSWFLRPWCPCRICAGPRRTLIISKRLQPKPHQTGLRGAQMVTNAAAVGGAGASDSAAADRPGTAVSTLHDPRCRLSRWHLLAHARCSGL